MNKQLILLLVAIGLGLSGCAKAKKSNSESTAASPYPPVAGPDVPGSLAEDGTQAPTNGHVVEWVPNMGQLDKFKATAPVNDPRDFKMWVNLLDTGAGNGGDIQVQWKDSGKYMIRFFRSVNKTGAFPCSNCGQEYNSDLGTPPERWNLWGYYNSKPVFHGMFEDTMGAIVIMIEDGLDLGDGGGITDLSGSIWYKNFTVVRAPESYFAPCWFIKAGPYQCKSDLAGYYSPYQSLNPGAGYTKLGTFHGLDRVKAFNQNWTAP